MKLSFDFEIRGFTYFALCAAGHIASIASVSLAIALLWGWFIVPLGVAAIGILHAFGVYLVGRVIIGAGRKAHDDMDLEGWWTPALFAWFLIALGYITQLFI